MLLRQINIKDKFDLKSIYFDSINSIEGSVYSAEQKFAWSSQAWDNPEFDNVLANGKGWVVEINSDLKGFAIRYPLNKLSLLYCRKNFKRKGIGTLLINKIEDSAKKDNINCIKTEASLISYKLLLRNNWEIIRREKIIIQNISFIRYKMFKNLL